jgi:hypothetical protein
MMRIHVRPILTQGRYIPLFASAVYDQNARLVEQGLTPINLKSAIIGSLAAAALATKLIRISRERHDRLFYDVFVVL